MKKILFIILLATSASVNAGPSKEADAIIKDFCLTLAKDIQIDKANKQKLINEAETNEDVMVINMMYQSAIDHSINNYIKLCK